MRGGVQVWRRLDLEEGGTPRRPVSDGDVGGLIPHAPTQELRQVVYLWSQSGTHRYSLAVRQDFLVIFKVLTLPDLIIIIIIYELRVPITIKRRFKKKKKST